MKKILCLFLVGMLLVACHAKESIQEETSNDTATMQSFDDSYYKIVNFGGSELREDFYTDYGAISDFETIGRGLQILSSHYFSTSSYYMSEGQYLKLSNKTELVRRSSDPNEYPYTLQPAKGSKIDNEAEPIMVSNIQEQDYYVKDGNKYTLKGLSFAIILDPLDKDGHVLSTRFSDSIIENYGKECIQKFYTYFQESEAFEKVKNLPVLISIYYATDTTSSTVNGNYILKCFCDKELGSVQKVNHETVLFASSRASELDKTTASEFDIVKQSLKDSAIEAAGFQGTARYYDGKIQSMVIEAHLNVKTYTELLYLTSVIADNIDSKFTYDFDIKVLVSSQDQLQAIIIKNKGEKAKSQILY